MEKTGSTAPGSKFVAKEKFLVNTKNNAIVKISHIGSDFVKWFLLGDGKIEDLVGEQVVFSYHKLPQQSSDSLIIAELGGEASIETTLSAMFSLMEKQTRGEQEGVLLVEKGWSNLFFIRDSKGVLRIVNVYWRACAGSSINAYSIDDSVSERWERWSGVFFFKRD